MKRYQKSLFIFRRDLRLTDNTGLNAALANSVEVIPVFILDPRQIDKHPYQSRPALQFMLQSLEDLQRQITEQNGVLHLYRDSPEQVISWLQQHGVAAVFVNRDYTPFSVQRDAQMLQHCQRLGIAFHSYDDLLLNPPEQILKPDGQPYQVFTAFYNRARQNPVARPSQFAQGTLSHVGITDAKLIAELKQTHTYLLSGGRAAALQIMQQAGQNCAHYQEQRDYPAQAATSFLSAYLKFGCVSIRETYQLICDSYGEAHPLLRQYYWRDFFSYIGFHFPHVFGHAFHQHLDTINWRNDQQQFWAWANGNTGFPIVDAAMRQLNQTGWMHNRLRMVTASFLVKDLHISWRWGERYFAQHLLDYDPCLNNGNWQWAASTGCDAQPYFRIFNPWLQQQKFDKNCVYIKQWLPELQGVAVKTIQQWHLQHYPCDYPAPIVDHAMQSKVIKGLFAEAIENNSHRMGTR